MGQSQELSQKKPDVVSDSENLIKQARAHCRDYLTKREEIYVEEVGNVSKELTSPPALPKMWDEDLIISSESEVDDF